MKLCKDCRWVGWYRESFGHDRPDNAYCRHETSLKPERTNLVTGHVTPVEPLSCTQVRWSLDKQHCGEAGRYWEPVVAGFG